MAMIRFIVIIAVIGCAGAANILGIAPFFATSHFNIMQPVFLELAKRGHNLTVISTKTDPNNPPNYRQIKVDDFNPNMLSASKIFPQDDRIKLFQSSGFMTMFITVWSMFQKVTEITLQSKEVKEFIKSDESKFDLIICEEFALSPYYMFAHKYDAPLVTITPLPYAHYISHYMGNPMNLHYMNHELISNDGNWNLWTKVCNVFWTYFDILVRTYYFMPKNEEIARKAFNSFKQPLPSVREIQGNTSFVFLNSNFAMDHVKSLLPNMVEVGGIHIRPSNPLPKDLQDIMDNAKEGAIVFTFGSNIVLKDLPKQKIDSFLKVFSTIKQTILMKWENDVLPGKPENVVIKPWLPQSDLLGHPNTKLFITHGGLSGILETVHHGVPIIGVPLFGDQPINVAKAKGHGYAEYLDYESLSEDKVKSAIDKILSDPKYSLKVKELSVLMKDRPMSQLNTAIYWIEYVIRHKGAYHLKTPSSIMTWYEYYLLDVIAVMLTIGFVCFWISIKIMKFITIKCIRILFRKKHDVIKAKKIN